MKHNNGYDHRPFALLVQNKRWIFVPSRRNHSGDNTEVCTEYNTIQYNTTHTIQTVSNGNNIYTQNY